jgi:hypothetical protein
MALGSRGTFTVKNTGISAVIGAVLAVAAASVGAGAASAQDPSLSASFGSVRLRSGFTPDPYVVSVYAGGSINAYRDTNLPGACVGKIARAPDFSVTYSAGSLPLVFRVVSNVDTSLIVNGPDGRWACDDDSYGDLDPQVVYRRPDSGKYDIWVGVMNGDGAQASLRITETP